MAEKYGVVVIGGGPGGYEAALEAASRGIRAAVVEKDKVGGTCLNRGCIPTKTFMHAVNVLSEIRDCEILGISCSEPSFDIEKMYDRKDQVVEKLQSGIMSLLKKQKVDFYQGTGRITGPGKVAVSSGEGAEEVLECDNIIIAAGSAPVLPPVKGIELEGVVTSDQILGSRCPAYGRLTIIGGGVIGIELATIYNALGTQVTIVEAGDRIAAHLDREISQSLMMKLKKSGVTVYTGAVVESLEQGKAEGEIVCNFMYKEEPVSLVSDGVLAAAGRRAVTDGILAAGCGIDLNMDERGFIPADECGRTNTPGIYAIGDVVQGGLMLAHMASAQGRNAASAIAGGDAVVNMDLVPSCMYTEPEVGCIGLTADQAKAQGIPVKTGKALMTANGKTVIQQGDRGFIKVVADQETGRLLGAQLMCGRATDMLGELELAVSAGLTLDEMSRVMRAHPTYNEAIADAVAAAMGK